ncbi:hypothetical protein A0H81_06597 [Grifola frondosa]|uniref:Uncharacterized protein n=1 Tax=Grifola frondosa TaxID=5627 RepID=A0A1C7M841_GRIFR|nr:hypothetical protein A0H81_06597 [Grifola frondosa]
MLNVQPCTRFEYLIPCRMCGTVKSVIEIMSPQMVRYHDGLRLPIEQLCTEPHKSGCTHFSINILTCTGQKGILHKYYPFSGYLKRTFGVTRYTFKIITVHGTAHASLFQRKASIGFLAEDVQPMPIGPPS